MIKISTIIPCFNSSRTLEDSIISIQNQSRKSDQIIIVDDGSFDTTSEVVRKYPSVEYIWQSNAGVSIARNTGVANATGNWIAFCDADDIWHPEKLANIECCIEQSTDCSFLFHNFYLIEEGLKKAYMGIADDRNTIFPFFRENKITFKKIFQKHKKIELNSVFWRFGDLYSGNVLRWLVLGNFILPSTLVIRQELFKEIGGFDPEFRSAEETEFFLRASKHAIFHYLDLPLTGYRKSSNGLTGNIPKLLENSMRGLYKNTIQDLQIYTRYKKIIKVSTARRYARLANYLLSTGYRHIAFRMLIKGLRHSSRVFQLWIVLFSLMLPIGQLSKLRKKIKNNCYFKKN